MDYIIFVIYGLRGTAASCRRLVLHLNEAENDRQDRLGDERLLEAMQGTEQLTSEEVIHRLQVVVNNHRAGAEPNDDLTLLCLSIRK